MIFGFRSRFVCSNRNIDFSAGFESNGLSILVLQGVFNANLFVKIIRTFDRDLCLFRLLWDYRRDYLLDRSR